MRALISIVIGYLLGSIPSSYLIAKSKGIDITRKVKDGRIGTVSTISEVGKFYGFLVGLMDFCKGAISIIAAEKIAQEEWVMIASGLAAIIGHNWSLFLGFKGGKGEATTFGNLFYLLPLQFLFSAVIIIVLGHFFKKIPTKREDFLSLPFNRQMRKSTFLTIVLFSLISFFAFLKAYPPIYIFSPLFFSPPILLKKNK